MSVTRKSHVDVVPGLMFRHARNPKPDPWMIDEEPTPGVWTVIQKLWVQKMDGGYWEYLLLGPGPDQKPVLVTESLGWIEVLHDPKVRRQYDLF